MGLFCIKHDAQPQADFPRGRPWPPARRYAGATVVPVPVPVAVLADAPERALTTVRPAG
jgi:hypothetical protein